MRSNLTLLLLLVVPLLQESEAKASSAFAARPFVIDHLSIQKFGRIPDKYLQEASQLRFLMRNASIGANIDQGLNCLMNNFPDRPKRPHFCDRDISPGQVVFDRKYDRHNWIFEFRGNPGWWAKTRDFIDRVNQLGPGESYDVMSFNFNYGDAHPGSAIADKFFKNDPGDNLPSAEDLEALEAAHRSGTFVWWTMALARRSTIESQNFNRQLRAYALAHKKVLLDIADIQSHRPDGSPCIDSEGGGTEAICQDYTNEKNSGHLNALGSQRMAQAIWVLMSRLAGWNEQ